MASSRWLQKPLDLWLKASQNLGLRGRADVLGVLTEITGQARNRRFRYDTYVRLFEAGKSA